MTKRKQRSFGLDELFYRVDPVLRYIEQYRKTVRNDSWRVGRPGSQFLDTLNGIQLQPRHKRRLREWPDRGRVGISSVDTLLVHYELTSGLFELWCQEVGIDPLWRPTSGEPEDEGSKARQRQAGGGARRGAG